MGNSCSGLKEKLAQRLRPLPSMGFFRRRRKNKEFSVVVLGARGVGKSALVKRWVNGEFCEQHEPTVSDTYRQELGDQDSGTSLRLRITDLAGGYCYPGLQCLAIARGHAFILVYSVTKKQTLEELRPYYEMIRELKGRNRQKYPIVLVGNKCDDSRCLELSTKDGAAYALKWDCAFLETSAKEDVNVRELFFFILSHRIPVESLLEPHEKSQMPEIAKKLLACNPCASEPCESEPCPSEPCESEPCASEPCESEPCAPDPCASEPFASDRCASVA